jgi:hypothetical protein
LLRINKSVIALLSTENRIWTLNRAAASTSKTFLCEPGPCLNTLVEDWRTLLSIKPVVKMKDFANVQSLAGGAGSMTARSVIVSPVIPFRSQADRRAIQTKRVVASQSCPGSF